LVYQHKNIKIEFQVSSFDKSGLPETPKKDLSKLNCMLFLNPWDYLNTFGLFWKGTLWGLFLNS